MFIILHYHENSFQHFIVCFTGHTTSAQSFGRNIQTCARRIVRAVVIIDIQQELTGFAFNRFSVIQFTNSGIIEQNKNFKQPVSHKKLTPGNKFTPSEIKFGRSESLFL